MNAKNKLIEKLLRVAKKHKILTYPVLALVAFISFFGNLFTMRNGAGKRVIAIVMVMVMFVSQSYFLTSSATALVDDENAAYVQAKLQAESEAVSEQKDDSESKEDESSAKETVDQSSSTTEGSGEGTATEITTTENNTAEVTSETSGEEQNSNDAADGTTTEETVTDVTDETASDVTDIDGEEDEVYSVDSKLDAENVQCSFYYFDYGTNNGVVVASFNATTKDGIVDNLDGTYNISSALATAKSKIQEDNDYAYSTDVWYFTNGSNAVGDKITDFASVKVNDTGNNEIRICCKRQFKRYVVNVSNRKVNGSQDLAYFSSDVVACDQGDMSSANSSCTVTVSYDGDKPTATLKLTGLSRTGYTLAGVESNDLDKKTCSVTPGTDSASGEVEITWDGTTYDNQKYITLIWKPDTYTIVYNLEERDSTGEVLEKIYEYDQRDVVYIGTDVVPNDGYLFDNKWQLVGVNPAEYVTAGGSLIDYQDKFYKGNGSKVVLKPVTKYDNNITLSTEKIEFSYKKSETTNYIKASYSSAKDSTSGSQFSYTFENEMELFNNYGITIGYDADKPEQGFCLITSEDGPTDVVDSFKLKVKITDKNALNSEAIDEQVIKISISRCSLRVKLPEGLETEKVYDGNTRPKFYTGDDKSITLNTEYYDYGQEKWVDCNDITVKCLEKYITYDSCDAGDNRTLTFDLTNSSLSGTNASRYVIGNGGNQIAGKITKKTLVVIPIMTTSNHILTGEDDPGFTFNLQNESDVVDKDKNYIADLLSELTAVTNRSDKEVPGTYKFDGVNTSKDGVSSNYQIAWLSDTSDNYVFYVSQEAPERNSNYCIGGELGANGWYYNPDSQDKDDGVTISAAGIYNTVELSLDGGGTWSTLDKVKDEDFNSEGSNVYIRLRSVKDKGGTGAVTSSAKLDLMYDAWAPVYDGYSFSQSDGVDEGEKLAYASGNELNKVAEGALYFPGIGGVMSFGTYMKTTFDLTIKYEDKRSGLDTLYYGLNGSEPAAGSGLKFNADGEVTISIPGGTKGTIKCYASDLAGNKSITKQLSYDGETDSYEWIVEDAEPSITSFEVRGETEGGNGTISVYPDRKWYNHCVAEVSATDEDSGIHDVIWYLKDGDASIEVSKCVYSEEKKVAVTESLSINSEFQEKYPNDDSCYTLYAVVEDNSGNQKLTREITFYVDDVAPVYTVTSLTHTYTQNKVIEFTVSDALSGMDYVTIKNGEDKAQTISLGNPDEDGLYHCSFEVNGKDKYTIVAVDNAGNVNDSWSYDVDWISNQIPDCPEISISPEANGEWYSGSPTTVTIQNVTETEDGTPVDTYYKLSKTGDAFNATKVEGESAQVVIPSDDIPDGIYILKKWSISRSGVYCSTSEDDTTTIKVDTSAPEIQFTTSKGSGSSILVSFTVTDELSGVNLDTVKVIRGGDDKNPVNCKITETDNGCSGSFEITETGDYTIEAADNAGNASDVAAFTPMSMKVKAVTNISTNSATVGANVIKGTSDIASVSIAYRKATDSEYKEVESHLVKDSQQNAAVSSVLSELSENTIYVYKITAVSEALSQLSTGEVLEYEGYFKTLATAGNGATVNGAAKYASGMEKDGDITVGIYEGNVCIMATDVNANSEFTFSNVPDGNYSIVATDGTYSTTKRLLIEDGVIIDPDSYIDLVLSGRNTAVVITTSDTPNITADMESIFSYDTINFSQEDKDLIAAGGTVEFQLYATLKTVTAVSANEISAMYAVTDKNKVVGAYLDLSLWKVVTDADGVEEKTQVTKLSDGASVSVTIPLGDLAGKSGLEVVRIHGESNGFTGKSLSDLDSNPSTYTISTTKFSTYAILYSPDTVETTTEQINGVITTGSVILDGTATPSQSGAVYAKSTTAKEDPDSDDDDDDEDTDNSNDDTNSSSATTASVGSLRSSGTAKTGDVTPIAALGTVMLVSMAGFFLLIRKNKTGNN